MDISLLFIKSMYLHSDMIFFLSLYDSHSFLLISDKLSTRLDNEVDINLKLSINFSLYMIVLLLSSSFLIGTEKVMYFSVFFPKQLKLPLNSSTSCLIMK